MPACRQCGAELPQAAKFCPACGSAVGARTGEERKIVTVLFADLVESTATGDGRDPEDIRAAIRPQLERIRATLEQYGGTFEKYVGDAVMAVFGAPLSHEDDPERAVRAALAIRDQLGDEVRVATNTGEAVVAVGATAGTGEGIATGDVVTTTFRIEQAAPRGTVLVGESTFRATRDAIDYCDPRTISAKGKSEPIVVYEALAALPEPSRDSVLPLAPLVGRREELSLILDSLSRARRDKTVQLLTIVGPPGIGKSRLVWELQAALEGDPGLVMWRRGRCLPYGDRVTFWALGEIVKGQAGVRETDRARETHEKLHRAVRDLIADAAEAEWVEGHLRPLVGLAGDPDTDEDRAEAFAAWRRFIEALAEWGPLVLTLDDIHWADDGLLDFIDHLADWVIGYPLVLLCTARPELHERRPTWGARPNAATIALAPLKDAEAGQLLAFLLRQSVVPTDLRDALLARAEGNPLYAQEFVRMLIDRGLLQRAGEEWHLTTENLPLPESLQAILASRLDALPHDDKELLRDAAVLGRAFWPGGVVAVSGRSESEIVARLQDLERREFVRRRPSSALAGQTEYVFNHVLARDVAYAQIPRGLRSEKHAAAAEWLEEVAGDRQDRLELLAHHLWKSYVFGRASGRDLDPARAVVALLEAGERALALNAFDAAYNYLDAALELLPEDAPERPKALALMGEARFRGEAGGEQALGAAVEALEASGDWEAAAEATLLLYRLLWNEGRHGDANAQLRHAWALVGDRPQSPTKAKVLAWMSSSKMVSDESGDALELARDALQMSEELGLVDLRGQLLATIGGARVKAGDAEGLADLEESIRLLDSIGSPSSVLTYMRMAAAHFEQGDLASSAKLNERARQAASRFGDAPSRRWLEAERIGELYWRGHWDECFAQAEAFIASLSSGSPHYLESFCRCLRAHIRLARGEVTAAVSEAELAVAAGRRAGDAQTIAPAVAVQARVMSAVGEIAAAADIAAELLESLKGDESIEQSWGDLAVALHAGGSAPLLLEVLDGVQKWTRWREAARAYSVGDFVTAADLYALIGSLPDEAYARLQASRALEAGGDVEGAEREAALAQSFFDSVSAVAYLRDATAVPSAPPRSGTST
jgi:class 3 adenylate cyclase/tetratricopeptide (TPR) repeat protein